MKWLSNDYKIDAHPARELLWVEVTRYLTAIFHPPPNLQLSYIVQRWHIIFWILTKVKSPFAKANIKQALFFDWPFFDPARDQPMNLEPAILIIHYCMVTKPSQRALAYELLEYLVHYSEQYEILLLVLCSHL